MIKKKIIVTGENKEGEMISQPEENLVNPHEKIKRRKTERKGYVV